MKIKSSVLQMLAGVLERCMKRRGVRDCDPYDWEKGAEVAQSLTTSSSSTAVPSKPQQRLINAGAGPSAGANANAGNVASENLCDDGLATSLNNQVRPFLSFFNTRRRLVFDTSYTKLLLSIADVSNQ